MRKVLLLLVIMLTLSVTVFADSADYGRVGAPPEQTLSAVGGGDTPAASEDLDASAALYAAYSAFQKQQYEQAYSLSIQALGYKLDKTGQDQAKYYRNESLYHMIEAKNNQADYPTVLKYCDKLESYKPDKGLLGWLYFYRGNALYLQNKYPASVNALTAALKITPGWERALLIRANDYFALNNYPAAKTDYLGVVATLTGGHSAVNDAAYRRWLSKFVSDGAITGANQLMLAAAYDALGGIDAIGNAYRAGYDDYSCAIIAGSSKAITYYYRAECALTIGLYPEAIDDYTKAEAKGLKDEEVYAGRAESLARNHNYVQSISDYTKAIKLNPAKTSYYYQRGIAEVYAHKTKEALADFTNCLQQNPASKNSRYYHGLCAYALKKPQLLLEDANYLVKNFPDLPEGYQFMGLYYQMIDSYNEAHVWGDKYQEALKNASDDTRAEAEFFAQLLKGG